MISRRTVVGGLSLALCDRGASRPQPAGNPNLVVLLADDLGYGDVSCYGSMRVPTPNIDRMAANGIRFTDGYVTAAVCSPTRAGLLTGRYQQRFGHEYNLPSPDREGKTHAGLPLSEVMLPQLLRQAGYATGIVGKWHLGASPEFRPAERGFDEFFGFLLGANTYVTDETSGARRWGTKYNEMHPEQSRRGQMFRGREPVEEREYLTDALGREAVTFIERQRKRPFFLYLAFNAVHTPFETTTKYLDRFGHITDKWHRMYAAMISALDDNIGRVLDKLRETGLDRNTLVVFLSDNGCPVNMSPGSNAPLNGGKGTLYEGGIRLPFLMQWTGKLRPGQVCRNPVSSLDVTATCLSLAGGKPAAGRPIDGVDLMPYLIGKDPKPPHETLFWRSLPNFAARKDQWKMIQTGDGTARLYNLAEDIGETRDLSRDRPALTRELRDAIREWNATLTAPRWPHGGSSRTVINGESITWWM